MPHRHLQTEKFHSCPSTCRGYELLKEGNQLSDARKAFEEAVSINCQNGAAHAGLGICFRGLQDLEESIACFKQATVNCPENPAILLEYIFTQLRAQYDVDALDNFIRLCSLIRIHHLPQDCADKFVDVTTTLFLRGKSDCLLNDHSEQLLFLITSLIKHKQLKWNDSEAATLSLVISVHRDRSSEIQQLIRGSLATQSNEKFAISLALLKQMLEKVRIGGASSNTLRECVRALTLELHSNLKDNQSLSHTNRVAVLCLLGRMRDKSVLKTASNLDINFESIPDNFIVELMSYSVPTITTGFSDFRISDKSVFRRIVQHCFNELTHSIKQAFSEDAYLIQLIKALNNEQQEDLTFKLHQSSYNCISSGYRKIGVKFTQALAETNKIIFGTYDCFTRNGPSYITADWVSAFGHIVFLEILLRLESAGLGPKLPRTILCYDSDLANPDCKIFLQENGFEFVTPKEVPTEPRRWQMDYIALDDNTVLDFMTFMNQAQATILDQCLPPFLKLPEEWLERGKQWLNLKGVTADDHVAVIHCRESSFWPNLNNLFVNARNADITNYQSTIEYLLGNQFHVFRIGDKGHSPIPDIEHPAFYDLTQTPMRERWLDYYLLHRAELFIGTNSGPAGVANVFGTPCLLTNWYPLHTHISMLNPKTYIMPKLLRRTGQLLNLQEMLEDPYSSAEHIDCEGIHLVNNTSAELLEATRDMLSQLAGDLQENHDSAEEELQACWSQHFPWSIKLPPSFMKKYQHILR